MLPKVAYSAITLHVILAFPVPFHACAETLESMLGIREKVQEPGFMSLVARIPRFLLLAACALARDTAHRMMRHGSGLYLALLRRIAQRGGRHRRTGHGLHLAGALQLGDPTAAGLSHATPGASLCLRGSLGVYDYLLGVLCLFVGFAGAATGLYYGLQDLVHALQA